MVVSALYFVYVDTTFCHLCVDTYTHESLTENKIVFSKSTCVHVHAHELNFVHADYHFSNPKNILRGKRNTRNTKYALFFEKVNVEL